ncbi:MAG: lipopolysaccharide biosynthesis protein [Sporolactobacillus sp.]
MNDFVKKLVGFSLGPIGGALIAFVTIPVTTHFVAPQEYGKAGMFTLVQTLFVTFLYLGIDQAYTREFHETQDRRCLFQNALLIPLVSTVLLAALLTLRADLVSRWLFGRAGYRAAVMLMALMLIFMVIERFILLSVRMQEQAFAYSLFAIVIKLVVLASTLVFVLAVRRDFLAVVYSAAIGQIAADVYLIVHYRHLLDWRAFHYDQALLRRLLMFGLPLVVAASAAALLNAAGRLALRTWSTFFEIGIFTATLKISAVLSVIQTSFTNFWVPTAYRWYSERRTVRDFQQVSEAVLLGMSVLFFGVLVFKQLIVFVLSPAYADAVYSLGFLCLQPVMYTVSETTTLGIVFSRKSYLNILVSAAALLPCLLLNVVLVPRYGAAGAAAATGVAYLFFFCARSFFSATNWHAFSLKKHYSIACFLAIAAALNACPIPYITVLNMLLCAAAILLQWPSLKQMVAVLHCRRPLSR